MFEDELTSDSTTDQLLSDTIEDAREKLERAIIKYAYISQDAVNVSTRLKEIRLQMDDARREMERLQETHVDLIVKKTQETT